MKQERLQNPVKIFKDIHRAPAFNFLLKAMENPDDLEKIKDVHLICLEQDAEGEVTAKMPLLDDVINELNHNPDAKFILTSMLTLDFIKKRHKKILLLAGNPNVRFFRIPPVYLKEVYDIFENEDAIINFPDENPKEVVEIEQERIKEVIGIILHDLDHEHLKEKTIKKAREFFVDFQGKTDEEVFNTLKQLERRGLGNNVEVVMEGKKLEGVFCDIEGTLFKQGKLNEKILNKLKQFESDGKQITLWTGGDTKELQILLNENEIIYPLKRKKDFAGAEAEIIIDDQPYDIFKERTKITAKKFIQA